MTELRPSPPLLEYNSLPSDWECPFGILSLAALLVNVVLLCVVAPFDVSLRIRCSVCLALSGSGMVLSYLGRNQRWLSGAGFVPGAVLNFCLFAVGGLLFVATFI